jgi:hypothetical protein
MTYTELEIRSRRLDAKDVEIWVESSASGTRTEPYRVVADARRLSAVRLGMEASWEETLDLGVMLAGILVPPPVYHAMQQALRDLAAREGLRVRLALDPSLIDLPWECVYRPDARGRRDISGFVFLDPRISLVRCAARRGARLTPSDAAQELVFLGTYWPGGQDQWEVEKEFNGLALATRPIGQFLSMRFLDVVRREEVERALRAGAAIVHYSGHAGILRERGYLVREANAVTEGMRWYAADVGPLLRRAKAHLVVLSACNSGRWPVVEPLLAAGVPALIGAREGIANLTAIAFYEKLYAALAVGLSLDEAVTFARQHLLTGAACFPCEWAQFMVYMPSRDAVLFPRPGTRTVQAHQRTIRRERTTTIDHVRRAVTSTGDGSPLGWISEGVEHNVLLLGRFTGGRMKLLEALCAKLREHKAHYEPIIFDFEGPKERNLRESVLGLALSSRFVIADVSEPRSVPLELDALATNVPSVPLLPIHRSGTEPFAMLPSPDDYPAVLPAFAYRDERELLANLESRVIRPAERKFAERHRRAEQKR